MFTAHKSSLAAIATLLASISGSLGAVAKDNLNLVTTNTPNGEVRRLTPEGNFQCRLWDACIMLEGGVSIDEWECNGKIIAGAHGEDINKFMIANGVESGNKILILKNSAVTSGGKIIIDLDNDVVGFEDYEGNDRRGLRDTDHRSLSEFPRTQNTLVVRVSGNDGFSPPPAATLSDDIFGTDGDQYNLKEQMKRCSHNKELIQEYSPGFQGYNVEESAPGVVDIQLDMAVNNGDLFAAEAEAEAKLGALFGVSNPGAIFDLVMFCMPPGLKWSGSNWLAYAYIGGWSSFYNDDWCNAMSAQMHEVGHNLGFHHSGEANEYDDESGFMGYSYKYDDYPKMCFNAAKNYEIGWFDDKTRTLAAADISAQPTEYTLNGLVDYESTTDGADVIIKVGDDWYISYNRGTQFNSETREAFDQVTVHEQTVSYPNYPDFAPFSKMRAHLVQSDAPFEFLAQGETIRLNVKSLVGGEKDAVIELSRPGAEPEPTAEPTSAPTNAPTPAPTNAPTDAPTSAPTNAPTPAPTSAPTPEPTNAPTPAPTSAPTPAPTSAPTPAPTPVPTNAEPEPTAEPTPAPTSAPTPAPTSAPTPAPTSAPTPAPTNAPTGAPTPAPTSAPTPAPTSAPTPAPTSAPTPAPTNAPTGAPTPAPTSAPTPAPTSAPTGAPTPAPTSAPTPAPTSALTPEPTNAPTDAPTLIPTPEGCTNHATWVYRAPIYKHRNKTCAWLDKKNNWSQKKKMNWCKKRANEVPDGAPMDKRKVREFCKYTCDRWGDELACPGR